MPVATNSRSSFDALKRRASSSMNTPMAKEPATLMAIVPHGKLRPNKPHRRDVDEVAERGADGAADGDENE